MVMGAVTKEPLKGRKMSPPLYQIFGSKSREKTRIFYVWRGFFVVIDMKKKGSKIRCSQDVFYNSLDI
jgi:hypothetical protein